MPIHIAADLCPLQQAEFGEIAYRVMDHVFQTHRELGRMFDEVVYQLEIAGRIPDAKSEVGIEVSFEDFRKDYFLDLLVAPGAIFEFKAVDQLLDRHRAQLLNYLHLTGSSHGKLINLRPERVEHEFVNTSLTHGDRTGFAVDASQWSESGAVKSGLCHWMEACLRDWGTGLDVELYEDAASHFFGGREAVMSETDVIIKSRRVGMQRVRLVGPGVSFKITAIDPTNVARHEACLRQFLDHTALLGLQWVNIHRSQVTFKSLRKTG